MQALPVDGALRATSDNGSAKINGSRNASPGGFGDSGTDFMVSAPGKVIVFGEHAVVYGRSAIAAAISLRSYLHVTAHRDSPPEITLDCRDIELKHTWNIHSLPWEVFARQQQIGTTRAIDLALNEAIQPYVNDVSLALPAKQRKIHQSAAAVFLYLLLSISSPENHAGSIYTMRSTIPIGAGLGSSASISVCLATALLLQTRTIKSPKEYLDSESADAKQALSLINTWAFLGEVLMHGNPSGVDNMVSTLGNAVVFKRSTNGEPPVHQPIDFPNLRLLLVDTLQPKSTAAEVAKVAELKERHPAVVEQILNGIDGITETAKAMMSSGCDPLNPVHVSTIGELVAMNHGLLYTLGVSHPRLERFKHLVERSGLGWAKLTGSGGGGCAFAVLAPERDALPDAAPAGIDGDAASETGLKALEAILRRQGFVQYETTIGGHGVGVLLPSSHSDFVDKDAFCAAEGAEALEALTGAARDWKYWSDV